MTVYLFLLLTLILQSPSISDFEKLLLVLLIVDLWAFSNCELDQL